MEKTSTREEDKEVNYSEVAWRYGLTTQNSGQSIRRKWSAASSQDPTKGKGEAKEAQAARWLNIAATTQYSPLSKSCISRKN